MGFTTRRRFVKQSLGAGLYLSLPSFAKTTKALHRLSFLAFQSTDLEGHWKPRKIEGQIPLKLRGTLYRNGPGSKTTQGSTLSHFFDGDAYVSALQFAEGQVQGLSRFVQTAERQLEALKKQMLFHDFGTKAPGAAKGYKNAPSIHLLPWKNRLLALSESTAPTQLNPESLETLGLESFSGTFPSRLGFSAHPKIDPVSGDLYSFGSKQSLFSNLIVYKIRARDNHFEELANLNLGGFFPVHDMLLTENYIVLVIPPLKVQLTGAALQKEPIQNLLQYQAKKPLRIVVIPKQKNSKALVFESFPSGMTFHHINAFEVSGGDQLIFDTLMLDNADIFQTFATWGKAQIQPGPGSQILRFHLDIKNKRLLERTTLSRGLPTDFPALPLRQQGTPHAHFYSLETRDFLNDPLAFDQLCRWDLHQDTQTRVQAGPEQMFGEPVTINHPENPLEDWLTHLGYDSSLNETFLDIRRAENLELLARVWLGRFLPLGFHGTFISST